MIVLANNVDKIRDNLWLGGSPQNVTEYQYVFCFNGKTGYYIPNYTTVVVYPFEDAAWMPPEDKIHELAKQVLAYSKRAPTLVHCSAGLNRSALVMALALMYDGMTAQDAIALLREKRGEDVLHNKTFVEWLMNTKL